MVGLLAFVLITLGTIGAAIGVARTDTTVEGWVSTFQVRMDLTLVSLAVLVTGIVLARMATRAAARAEAANKEGGSLGKARAALSETLRLAAGLQGRLSALGLDALHGEVDALVNGPVADFVDNRLSITDNFGVGAYAEVMAPFATAERYLNRAWSSSADGYLQEAVDCVGRAVPRIEEAERAMSRLAG